MSSSIAFWLGIAVLAVVWLAPLIEPSAHSFTNHMASHMSVVVVAAALLAMGVAGGTADPARRWPDVFSPLAASLLEFIVVWLWHTPVMHHAAQRGGAILAAEQLSFLAAGFTLWIAVLGGNASERDQRTAAGLVALLLTLMHMTLLGALIALSPRPLYTHHSTGLADQQMGGAIMLVTGGFSYLFGGLWLAGRLLAKSISGVRPITSSQKLTY